ncbi:MAG: lipoyl(octanoyl) transferase LipB [Bacteroidales bacterium]|nr:lipoyl(octanoyl) transferase LipB [Bacteroidales bacterium]MDY0216121.1 lipoyl(octanoyl) transferase LipB [Bacteroidales bacterium]
MKAVFNDWGLIDYKEAWDKQQLVFESILHSKKNKSDTVPHQIIFCEHPHVYTLGKNGDVNNLLIQRDFLKSINASYYQTDRGGDITYHGPGQIVGYPIIDLEKANLSLKEYIFQMEKAIIDTLKEYDISAHRLDGATGVWLDVGTPQARKICAIGVRASRYVTMHGFAFNINTNLEYFNHINPCGFMDKGVTSLSKEMGKNIDIEEVKRVLKIKLYHTLNLEE